MVSVSKTKSAPKTLAVEKLKKSGHYDLEDVLQTLWDDFRNKCYLCEQLISSLIVEHFIPHRGNIDLKFAWENLFLACERCNRIKGTRYNTQEQNQILNCTKPNEKVETWLSYQRQTDDTGKTIVNITVNHTGQKTQNTVRLLNAIYNGTNFRQQLEADMLKDRLRDELDNFEELLIGFFDTLINDKTKLGLKEQIDEALQPDTPFTAFKQQLWHEWQSANTTP